MKKKFGLHPRAWVDAILTYPRFLGTIKPELLSCAPNEIEARLQVWQRAVWPKELHPPLARRILVLAPHPDDEVIGCGGLLLLHRGQSEIHIVNVYNGDWGGSTEEGPWRDEPQYKRSLVELRSREFESVTAKIGATSVTRLDVSDSTGIPGDKEAYALRTLLQKVRPQIVLLPWFLDGQEQHQETNRLFTIAAAGYECLVLGFEIWSLMPPTSFMDISSVIDEKLAILQEYWSQLRTVDYSSYVEGLARVRAFHHSVGPRRNGAAESYFAMPSREYCELSSRALEKSS
jgi:LmbE family N-acetylglucosaminyl deacetylase